MTRFMIAPLAGINLRLADGVYLQRLDYRLGVFTLGAQAEPEELKAELEESLGEKYDLLSADDLPGDTEEHDALARSRNCRLIVLRIVEPSEAEGS